MKQAFTTIYKKHGKHILTVTFFAGFVLDYLTLPSINNALYPYIGIFYFSMVALGIILQESQLNLFARGKGSLAWLDAYILATSFFLGSFLSYVFIYYVRGGDIYSNWPIYLLLLAAVFLNEVSLSRFKKLFLNVALLSIGVVFYVIYNAPLIFKAVSDTTFVLSLILSFGICFGYITVLTAFLHKSEIAFKLFLISCLCPVAIGGLYFANIIPAVPLTLRDTAVYSYVERNSNGEYTFVDVAQQNVPYLIFGENTTVRRETGLPLYFYGAVLAPAQVSSSVSHSWQKYDEVTKVWKERQNIVFPIVGGRKEGYRGYSILESSTPGTWRVQVKVGGKRIVGEKLFVVEN